MMGKRPTRKQTLRAILNIVMPLRPTWKLTLRAILSSVMPPNHATLKNILLYGLFGSNGEFLNVYICVHN